MINSAHEEIPPASERERLNAAFLTTGTETGFWDEQGMPAIWPDDIDRWEPFTNDVDTHRPSEQPF